MTARVHWSWRVAIAIAVGMAVDVSVIAYVLEPLVVVVPALHGGWLRDQALELAVVLGPPIFVYWLLTRYCGPGGGRRLARLRREWRFVRAGLGLVRCGVIAAVLLLAAGTLLVALWSFMPRGALHWNSAGGGLPATSAWCWRGMVNVSRWEQVRDPADALPRSVRWGLFRYERTRLGYEGPIARDVRVEVPLAWVALGWLVYPLWVMAWFWRGPVRLRRRYARGLCVACGYDLQGLAERRCPECGWTENGNRCNGRTEDWGLRTEQRQQQLRG